MTHQVFVQRVAGIGYKAFSPDKEWRAAHHQKNAWAVEEAAKQFPGCKLVFQGRDQVNRRDVYLVVELSGEEKNKIVTAAKAALEKAKPKAVLTQELSGIVTKVKSYHKMVRLSANTMSFGAFMAGHGLIALKEKAGHGNFSELVEAYLPDLTQRTATRYMALAEALTPKLPDFKSDTGMSVLPTVGLKLLSAPVKEAKKQTKAIAEAFFQATDGAALTELYRACGIIREPEKPSYHPRKNEKEPTIEEQLEIRRTMARENVVSGCKLLVAALHDLAVLPDGELDGIQAVPDFFLQTVRHWQRTPAVKRNADQLAETLNKFQCPF